MYPFEILPRLLKKSVLAFSLSLLSIATLTAQDYQWTWVQGDNLPNKPGIYGTKGEAAAGNTPGGRTGSVQWTDNSGNFWLFGGFGYAASGTGNLNDLWMFSHSSGQWTWVSGDNTTNAAAVYGTIGVADAANKPGARSESISFIDNAGKLWLMGGYNSGGFLNDLWKFDPLTSEWTWVGGDKTNNKPGIYGTRGSAATTNKPGARYSASGCVDGNGDFWLFGGYGYGSSSPDSYLNDLWKFDPSTAEWTWVSGDNITNQVGVYGEKGTADGSNKPGARYSSAVWADNSGNIFIFGGNGHALTAPAVGGNLNDLWKFNPGTSEWTWVSGDNAVNTVGAYGSQGVTATTNKPGGRYAAATWQGSDGTVYLFGGSGYAATASLTNLNDLWKWDPATGNWTWIGGTSLGAQKGIYGVKGASTPLTVPGARYSFAWWTDATGKLWLFGGSGTGSTVATGYLNDLWSYQLPHITLPVLFSQFTAKQQSSGVLLNWTTAMEENSHHFVIERSTNGTAFNGIGSVMAAGHSSGSRQYSFVDPAPVKGVNYYRLQQIDVDGKSMYSEVVSVVLKTSGPAWFVVQNPVQTQLQVQLQLDAPARLKFSIKDAAGNLLMTKQHSFSKGLSNYALPVEQLPKGLYYLSVAQAEAVQTKSFLKL